MPQRTAPSRHDRLLGAILAYCKANTLLMESEDALKRARVMRTMIAHAEAHDVLDAAGDKLKRLLPDDWKIGDAIQHLLEVVNNAYENHSD